MSSWIDRFNFSNRARHNRRFSGKSDDYNDKVVKNSVEYAAEVDVGGAIRVLGSHHETLRTRCETVISSLAIFRSASGEIEQLFHEFGKLAAESQENTKILKHTQTTLQKETECNRDLQEKIEHIQQRSAKLQSQVEMLISEKSISENRNSALEIQVKALQNELKDTLSRLREIELELSTKNADHTSAAQEVERLTLRVKAQDKAYNDVCEERRVVREKLLFETEERLKLSKDNEELSNALLTLNRQAMDLRSELDEASAKLIASESSKNKLEDNIHKYNAEMGRMQDLLRTSQAQLESERVAANMKLVGINSRLKLTEQLLERAREEGRRVLDERLIFDEATRRLKSAEAVAAELRQELKKEQLKVIELDQLRATLIERAESIQTQVHEKQLLNQQAAERIQMMQERFANSEEAYKSQIAKLSEQIKKMSDDVAAERSSRAFIEGALQTARLDRSQLQNKIIQLKKGDGHKSSLTSANVEEEHIREGEILNIQLASVDDNVTTLRQS